jgi:putative inorganic carbon (hco3(-)) transporter
MRDAVLAMIVLGILPLIFFRPHVGVLAWAWIAFMNPQTEVYSFLGGANLNYVIAILTLVALVFSRDKKLPPLRGALLVIIIFAVWTTVTTYTALNYDLSYEFWLRNIKTIIFAIMVAVLIDRTSRIHALILIIVISIGYWGAVSTLQTIAALGHARLIGPPGSMIGDNNNLALAMVMVFPLVEYCRYVAGSTLIRNGCIAGLVFLVIAILGTYSRGGLVALSAVFAVLLWRSKSLLLAFGIVAVAMGAAWLLPSDWSDRMATIETFQSDPDQSVQGRFHAWETAIRIGLDRPIVGGGYRATEDPAIYARYKSQDDATKIKAVHNAYLQVLADHGFVGLGLFVLMFFFAVRDCRWIAREASKTAELYWLAYLARMLEIGFIGFAVGALALSIGYYDLFVILIAMTSVLRTYAEHEIGALEVTAPPEPAPKYRVAPTYAMDSANLGSGGQ